MLRSLFLIAALTLLGACQQDASDIGTSRGVLVIGDSALAWNRSSNASVGDALEKELGVPVVNRAVSGAKISAQALRSLDIRNQYQPGRWRWVVMNGGANDLAFECGCGLCRDTLNRMISRDGRTGEIPTFVRQVRMTGARVAWMGYINPPRSGNLFSGCRGDVLELQNRIAQMAARDPGTVFVRMRDAFPNTDLRFYAADRIHPSPLGSAALARRLAQVIRSTP